MIIIQPLATIAFCVVGGIFALILGTKARLPSILFLLAFGILLGPHGANMVQPGIFREEFPQYVSILVSLILFEGGSSLKFSQLQHISGALRGLLSIGILVTLVLTAVGTHFIVGFSWTKSLLFGAIMIVTGPTVVLSILKRVRIKEGLHNILKWEAILIDSLGVVTAIVLFEFLISGHYHWWQGLWFFAARLLIGGALGLVAGWIMFQGLTRKEFLKFEGGELGGLFVLACNLLFYALGESILHESGLVVATVAGIYLGNKKFALKEQILHFKEQLTLLALSVLFILLSSNVPIGKIRDIWKEGTQLLIFLVFVVRPLSVFASTRGDKKLSTREKWFLALLAPRGIVSASLASLFAIAFEERALSRGIFLPLAFYVITGSIVFYALFAGFIARMLNVHEKKGKTIVIVGANCPGLFFAEEFRKGGVPVVFIDTNPHFCSQAREKGFLAYTGSGFDREFLDSIDLKGVDRMLALTPNHEVNVLSCQAFSRYLGKDKVFRFWDKSDQWNAVTAASYDESRGRPIFTPGNMLPEFFECFENPDLRTNSEQLAAQTVVTPDEMKKMEDRVPLFASLNGEIYFPYPKAVLPQGALLFFLKFDAKARAR